jgi:hypothetical protein
MTTAVGRAQRHPLVVDGRGEEASAPPRPHEMFLMMLMLVSLVFFRRVDR